MLYTDFREFFLKFLFHLWSPSVSSRSMTLVPSTSSSTLTFSFIFIDNLRKRSFHLQKVQFLPDPGVPGVRSMGLGLSNYLHTYNTFLKLCLCDSGLWWYQLNTIDWWCQYEALAGTSIEAPLRSDVWSEGGEEDFWYNDDHAAMMGNRIPSFPAPATDGRV